MGQELLLCPGPFDVQGMLVLTLGRRLAGLRRVLGEHVQHTMCVLGVLCSVGEALQSLAQACEVPCLPADLLGQLLQGSQPLGRFRGLGYLAEAVRGGGW